MLVNFKFNGTTANAEIRKKGDDRLQAIVVDKELVQQFGETFDYKINNRTIDFTPLNLAHSELYHFQSELRNAILQKDFIF